MSTPEGPSPRIAVRRRPERGSYDRAVVHGILDAGLLAHVAFVVDGQPFVVPMTYARIDDEVFLHGAPASRLQKQLASGIPASIGVTILDGLVLARSAYHHSMNFRSVVLFGTARAITDEVEKRRAFDALVDHVVPGRAARVRAASPAELRGTHVVSFRIEEASAKVRTGPPVEDPEDVDFPVWAGVIPLSNAGSAPETSADTSAEFLPDPVESSYRRSWSGGSDSLARHP